MQYQPDRSLIHMTARFSGKRTFRIRTSPCLLWFVALLAALPGFANEGVFLLGNDAVHMARGGSGIASPRTSYWSYLNPASMVDLERRVDVNWYTVFTDLALDPKGIICNPFDGKLKSDNIYNIVSNGIIWPLETGVLGGGLFVPSGTGAEYAHSRNLLGRLFFGNTDRRLEYQHMRLVLAYAYEFDNGWAVGAGLHGSLSRFKSDHITLHIHPTVGDFEWDDALGVGFNVGIYKRWETWAFGAAYTSRHWTQSFDDYEDLLAYPLDTPPIFHAGIAIDLTPRLQLTLDYKFINWKDVSAYGKKVLDGGFNWDDQHGGKVGIEWRVNENWTLMAGFAHTNSPIDEDHAFISGLVPVAVEDHVTAGLTYAINEHHEIHATLVHGIKNAIEDTGRGDLFSVLGRRSEVSANGNSVAVGYSYKF